MCQINQQNYNHQGSSPVRNAAAVPHITIYTPQSITNIYSHILKQYHTEYTNRRDFTGKIIDNARKKFLKSKGMTQSLLLQHCSQVWLWLTYTALIMKLINDIKIVQQPYNTWKLNITVTAATFIEKLKGPQAVRSKHSQTDLVPPNHKSASGDNIWHC